MSSRRSGPVFPSNGKLTIPDPNLALFVGCFHRSPWSLLGGYGSNYELVCTPRINRCFRPFESRLHQCAHVSLIQSRGSLESNAAHHVSAASEQSLGIREARALEKTETDALRL